MEFGESRVTTTLYNVRNLLEVGEFPEYGKTLRTKLQSIQDTLRSGALLDENPNPPVILYLSETELRAYNKAYQTLVMKRPKVPYMARYTDDFGNVWEERIYARTVEDAKSLTKSQAAPRAVKGELWVLDQAIPVYDRSNDPLVGLYLIDGEEYTANAEER